MDNSAAKIEAQPAAAQYRLGAESQLAPFMAWTPLARSPWVPKILPAVTGVAFLAALYLNFIVSPD